MIYLIYKTDVWHSHASKDLIGIGTSEKAAIKICILQSNKERCSLLKDPETLSFLKEKHQTQDYKGEGEFLILAYKQNFLL